MADLLDDAPAYWGAKAAEYDAFIRRVVPLYDTLIERLVTTLPAAPRHILELGCGTGNLSLRLIDAAPGAALTLVDAAPEMLELTRARLAAHSPASMERTRLVAARFEELDPEPGAYDVVVACISLHHVADPAPIYRALRRSLAPGGALRIADGYAAASAILHARHLAAWKAFWRAPGNLDDDEVRSVGEHVAQHDHYFDLATHFGMLSDAGFTAPDCVWRDGLFGILTAEAD